MTNEKRSTISISAGERPAWISKGRPRVVGLRLLGTATEFEMGSLEQASIGTEPARDFVLGDDCVSSFHCVLDRVGDSLVVQDRRSRNGTYVNSVRCERAEVSDGAILTLGRTHLVAFSERTRGRRTSREQLAGHDPVFLRAVDDAESAALGGKNVLIIGEKGTGRTLLANVIHEMARGSALPLITVDCTLGEDVANELFGDDQHEGALDRAQGGTLLVKEPARLPRRILLDLMEALARLSEREEAACVRLVAAISHVDETFDSYRPLDPTIVNLPPLRERMGDLRELTDIFLDEFLGTRARKLSPTTIAAFNRHSWKGNITELREAVRRLVALGTHRSIREATEALGLPRTTFRGWMDRLSLSSKRAGGEFLW